MFCTKCGFKNDDDAMFCASCGSVMTQNLAGSANQGMQQAKEPDTDNIQPVQQNDQQNQAGAPQMSSQSRQAEPVSQMEQVQPQQAEPVPQMEQVQPQQPKPVPQMEQVQPQQPKPVPQMEQIQSQQSEPIPLPEQIQLQLEPTPTQQPESVPPQVNLSKPEQSQETFNTMNDLYRSPYTIEPQDNTNLYRKKRFSVPKLILSLIVLLVTIASIATIPFDYASMKMTMEYDGDTEELKDAGTGYEIIKSDIIDEELDTLGEDASNDLADSMNLFRYLIIAFAVAMLIFAVIDFILLCAVRNRVAYVLSMIFAIIKAALGCGAIYIWSVDILGKIVDMYDNTFGGMNGIKIELDFMPEIGLILALSMQAVIFVCAIILMCIKPKYEDVAPQTMNA